MCSSVLQCVAVCVAHIIPAYSSKSACSVLHSMLQCVLQCVVQCVLLCVLRCVLQYVAVCC